MADKFYITTPLYYVNAAPHIGHSYTTIAADVLSRYMRKVSGKENVWFLTGTDEHGQKIMKAAQACGKEAKEFVDETSLKFKELWEKLNISYDDFIRTTQARHTSCVTKALEILHDQGEIYKDNYEGLYCTPCETFWLAGQAKDSLCPDCKRELEKISESNYFFNLEKHRLWLIDYIKANPGFILPVSRRNEVLSFLELNKLEPLCISRPKERLSWGIPLSFSPEHVTYVWFDALINYISAVGSFDANGKYQSKWWPAQLHLMAKDILRQHAIYWPIMLHALGIQLPKAIFAHGWWMINEDKMSKSRGNVVNPIEMVDKYGLDVYRYFLLREVPFGLDGNFSEEAIVKRYNADLANDLGNLLYRTLTMVEKYFNGEVPQIKIAGRLDKVKIILAKADALEAEVGKALKEYNFNLGLESIWELIAMANKFVEETKPWNLAKENKTDELKEFIRLLVEVIRSVAFVLAPFMPGIAEEIQLQIGGERVKKGSPLFPRIL